MITGRLQINIILTVVIGLMGLLLHSHYAILMIKYFGIGKILINFVSKYEEPVSRQTSLDMNLG